MNHPNVLFKWAVDLFPINRSITGPGLRETLLYLNKLLPNLSIKFIESGTKVFDWTVPKEWSVSEAYIDDKNGRRVLDFKENNLHLVGYSAPVNKFLALKDLKKNIYTLPNQPNAIPYVTSYYKDAWGFCMSHDQLKSLKEGIYKVVIKSKKKPGFLNYGELIIPGKSKKEIFLSTYICHPSMANNELSGPIVLANLAQWLSSFKSLNFTYRILFIPETIGSIAYLSKNYRHLKKRVLAGYNLTCLGDKGPFSFLPSRNGNTLSDKIAKHVLEKNNKKFKVYSWLDRGSDERQYCSPGIDLPVASVMRSKYNTFPEYHTSLDNLSFITGEALYESTNIYKKCIRIIEYNFLFKATNLCEPKLDKKGLYLNKDIKNISDKTKKIVDFLSYADGNNTLLDIAEKINHPAWDLIEIVELLLASKLIKIIKNKKL